MTAVGYVRCGPTIADDPADPIDRLMQITGGEVLQVPRSTSTGGEHDDMRSGRWSTRQRRQLAGARLTATDGGLPPDELLAVVEASALCPAVVVGMGADELAAWYVGEALAGLAYRADVRNGSVYDQLVRPEDSDTVPEWVLEWAGRLLHGPKRGLLMALAEWHYLAGPAPEIPELPWAAKLCQQFDNRRAMRDV